MDTGILNHNSSPLTYYRLSTVVGADTIMFLKEGEIVERGTHAQLIALDGEYANMWRMQQSVETEDLKEDDEE